MNSLTFKNITLKLISNVLTAFKIFFADFTNLTFERNQYRKQQAMLSKVRENLVRRIEGSKSVRTYLEISYPVPSSSTSNRKK